MNKYLKTHVDLYELELKEEINNIQQMIENTSHFTHGVGTSSALANIRDIKYKHLREVQKIKKRLDELKTTVNYYLLDTSIFISDIKKEDLQAIINDIKANKPTEYTDADVEERLKNYGYFVLVIDMFGDLIEVDY